MMEMNILRDLLIAHDQSDRLYGICIGVVTNNQDPDGLGRVKVRFPWLSDAVESNWARVLAPMAGKDRGIYFLPEVNDEVLLAFEQGDIRFPYVLGSLWNGKDKPPETNKDGKNDRRTIKSRSGHKIVLDDSDDKPSIEIVDKTEKNRIFIDSAKNAMEIKVEGDLSIEIGGDLKIKTKGKIDIDAKQDLAAATKGNLKVKTDGNSNIESSGSVNIKSKSEVMVEGTQQTKVKGTTVSINGSVLAELKGALVKIN